MPEHFPLQQSKKGLGRYYTPLPLAQTLADWAVRRSGTVFDPSFGGCAFLSAALRTLEKLGAEDPAGLLHGVDIDPDATGYLAPLLSAGAPEEQFCADDFFDVRPEQFSSAPFDVVLGNPPYVRHQMVPAGASGKAVSALAELGVSLSGRASYWAYFVLHSLRFLRRHGRLAMVLPRALLHADYAEPVRDELARRFSTVSVLLVQDHIFEDSEERTVILLADGYLQPHHGIYVGAVRSMRDLGVACRDLREATRRLVDRDTGAGWVSALVEDAALELFERIRATPSVVRLGDMARIRIGLVTGANDFFILSGSQARSRRIGEEFLEPTVRRAAYLKGLRFSPTDVRALIDSDKGCLLLRAPDGLNLPRGLAKYLQRGEEDGIPERYKCRSRVPWYAIGDRILPNAFLHYMSGTWPHVVLNWSKATCTNAIHRLTWRETRPRPGVTRVALGSLSTLTQFSAELVGRSYGGGVLKLEPGEAAKLLIPTASAGRPAALFWEVDKLLRSGHKQAATDVVDREFLMEGLGLSQEDLDCLTRARDRLFECRTGTSLDSLGASRGSVSVAPR